MAGRRGVAEANDAASPARADAAPGLVEATDPVVALIHDQFRSMVLHPSFSCLGAKAAVRGGAYQLRVYGELGTGPTTAALAHDLSAFGRTSFPAAAAEGPSGATFTTFVASFLQPVPGDEVAFERLLWDQLQELHDADPAPAWDPSVSPDPDDPHFSFSFDGRAYFVVGLHAASSRWARRFAWPTLVFNPHAQFEHLRSGGRFGRLQELIRSRERALQGSLNSNLGDFGERSEARQYSGRPVEDDWRCPFRSRSSAGDPGDKGPSVQEAP